ncbi:M20 family metallo-hydrolase [Gracilimonas mengyeensis]|uniref:Acetylornithine deacetylase n=1 Tax=Gracilimonas mengyeensis TaxID=1302730 RepID=A0A521CFJ3_9BACT|nr:M20 family metallo-hydrolase [Gracilimonas mengyeensis]SMO57551.1 acetylornithine deacetylase [Gracilimonas mengyeensis]
MNTIEELTEQAIELLKKLISIQSYSGEEDKTADLLSNVLEEFGFNPEQKGNNVWAYGGDINPDKPTLLLNSHHDTVKASQKWTKDPFTPTLEDGKLFGLGSNDAGGPLVSLLATFVYLSEREQPYNLVFLASAEEETSGKKGVPIVLPEMVDIDLAVVGEPTSMDLAAAERGLVVLDCISHGKSGHAARGEGENAIYKAMKDIEWFRNFEFEKVSEVLGAINMTVTIIEAGTLHNVVPDECRFVVDVRPNEFYSNEEVVESIRQYVDCEVKPRSLNLNASGISLDHPVVKKAESLGIRTYGSKTMSDQVHMPFDSIKMGPGNTHRSHTEDEFIYLDEIREGIKTYVKLLDGLEIE